MSHLARRPFRDPLAIKASGAAWVSESELAWLCDCADLIVGAGLVLHDPRLRYVEVQLDRDGWETVRALDASGGSVVSETGEDT